MSFLTHHALDTKPKTATASFRVDSFALETLHEDAVAQNVSINALLNQLLLTYANYDRPMNRFQMLKLSASDFRHVLRGAQDETIAEAGRQAGSDVPRTFLLAKWGRLTKENSLDYLKSVSIYAKLFDYSEVLNEGTLFVTLSHNFGAKGTVFLQNYVKAMFALADVQPKFSPDENAVVFELQ